MASEPARPTRKQLGYLRRLAGQTGTTFTPPATRAQAGCYEIERLKARPATPAAERRRERRAVQDAIASRGPASSIRREETTGYGSSYRALGARRATGGVTRCASRSTSPARSCSSTPTSRPS